MLLSLYGAKQGAVFLPQLETKGPVFIPHCFGQKVYSNCSLQLLKICPSIPSLRKKKP